MSCFTYYITNTFFKTPCFLFQGGNTLSQNILSTHTTHSATFQKIDILAFGKRFLVQKSTFRVAGNMPHRANTSFRMQENIFGGKNSFVRMSENMFGGKNTFFRNSFYLFVNYNHYDKKIRPEIASQQRAFPI